MKGERIIHFSVSLDGRQRLNSALQNFPDGEHVVIASAASASELKEKLENGDYSLVLVDVDNLTEAERINIQQMAGNKRGFGYSNNSTKHSPFELVATITGF